MHNDWARAKFKISVISRCREQTISFTVAPDPKKPTVWLDVDATSFFESYGMEGVYPDDEEYNMIYIEVNAVYLISALGKKNVNHIEIKLGKQDYPFFTINLKAPLPGNTETSNQVPLVIIPRLAWNDFQVTFDIRTCDAQAILPRFIIFKKYIDTFNYSNKIRFTYREDQTLVVEADQDRAARHFTTFKVKVYDCDENMSPYEGRAVTALVEQKKVSHWLHSISFSTDIQLRCAIKNNKAFLLLFQIRDEIVGSFLMSAEFEDDENSTSSVEGEGSYASPGI